MMTDGPTRRFVLKGVAAFAAAPTVTHASTTPKTHEIEIASFRFHPAVIQARVGDTIRWINKDLAPHTATANEFGWDTGELGQGEAAEVPVNAGMEPSYFCVFHPHMKGKIKVIE